MTVQAGEFYRCRGCGGWYTIEYFNIRKGREKDGTPVDKVSCRCKQCAIDKQKARKPRGYNKYLSTSRTHNGS